MNYASPDYEDDEKQFICLDSIYEEFCDYLPDDLMKINMPEKDMAEALTKAFEFIDMGVKDDGKSQPHTVDWEQDAPIIIPAVNRVVGKEIRSLEYMHWWTFLGAYIEIGESLFSQVVGVRMKKAKGKKLEKWEREFYQENKSLVNFKTKYSKEEQAAKERLEKWLT